MCTTSGTLCIEILESQVTDKFYHLRLYRAHFYNGQKSHLQTLVVLGTDGIGRCKSNYHMTAAPKVPSELVIKLMNFNRHDKIILKFIWLDMNYIINGKFRSNTVCIYNFMHSHVFFNLILLNLIGTVVLYTVVEAANLFRSIHINFNISS
jgi:hypothetical protein